MLFAMRNNSVRVGDADFSVTAGYSPASAADEILHYQVMRLR
jgi:hypothetical protein